MKYDSRIIVDNCHLLDSEIDTIAVRFFLFSLLLLLSSLLCNLVLFLAESTIFNEHQ